MASAGLGENFKCSICLSLYTDPVTLRCGHNFCRVCIDQVLNTQEKSGVYSCPECREEFQERPALQKNIALCNVVENFLSTHRDDAGIFCTYCVDSPVPAVKSCLLCEASLCDKHLRVHSKSPEHVLSEPTTSLENRKCSVHKKILEYYCTEDAACVCVSCYLIGDHNGHKMEFLDEASEKKKKKKKKKLRNALQKLIAKREETEGRVQSLEERRRKAQEEASGEAERVTALFTDIRRRLDDLEKRVLSEISRQEEKMSRSLSTLIHQLEIKMDKLSRKMRDIEELCNMTDPLTVLQEPDTGDLCDPEEGGGDEDTGGHGEGDEDTGGHDEGDEDTGGHDEGDEDTGDLCDYEEEGNCEDTDDLSDPEEEGDDEDTGDLSDPEEEGDDEDTGDMSDPEKEGDDEDTGDLSDPEEGDDEETSDLSDPEEEGDDEDTGDLSDPEEEGDDEDTGDLSDPEEEGDDEDTGDLSDPEEGDEDTGDLSDPEEGNEEGAECHDDQGLELILYMLSFTSDIIRGLGTFHLQDHVDILLDINTANNYLLISDDLKTVTWTNISQNRPQTAERFQYRQVMSSQSFSSGRHYWDVEVNGSDWWKVGMCYPSIDRWGYQSYIGYNNKSWGLCGKQRYSDQYSVLYDGKEIQLPHQISGYRVRIYVDYEAGELSFYRLGRHFRHLHTFTTTFTEPLHPLMGVWGGSIKISAWRSWGNI